jgi:uncharacterized lipoprotein YajG
MSRTKTTLLRRHRKALTGAVAAVAAAGVLAGCGSSSSTTSTANATPAAATSSSPQGVPPGMGTTVTGAAADKAKAAALAKYPGAAERVEKLSDGSYVVHVIRSRGARST